MLIRSVLQENNTNDKVIELLTALYESHHETFVQNLSSVGMYFLINFNF